MKATTNNWERAIERFETARQHYAQCSWITATIANAALSDKLWWFHHRLATTAEDEGMMISEYYGLL